MVVQVSSNSKTRSHVDIQVRSNVVLDIYIYMHVVRIKRWLNYKTVGLRDKYTGIWHTHSVT
jgi:hypothetical protein